MGELNDRLRRQSSMAWRLVLASLDAGSGMDPDRLRPFCSRWSRPRRSARGVGVVDRVDQHIQPDECHHPAGGRGLSAGSVDLTNAGIGRPATQMGVMQ